MGLKLQVLGDLELGAVKISVDVSQEQVFSFSPYRTDSKPGAAQAISDCCFRRVNYSPPGKGDDP